MSTRGKIIIIVAPSGTGKSTLIAKLMDNFENLKESVSYTTRPMRDGEVDGSSYFFIDEVEFKRMKASNLFLESAVVHNNFYGTSKTFVENKLNEGGNLLFDLDVQGTDSFKEYFKDDAKAIFIAPPSIEELETRLRGRGTETEDVINVRINNAKNEIKRKDDYDFCVVNDDFDRAYCELKEIFENILEGKFD